MIAREVSGSLWPLKLQAGQSAEAELHATFLTEDLFAAAAMRAMTVDLMKVAEHSCYIKLTLCKIGSCFVYWYAFCVSNRWR